MFSYDDLAAYSHHVNRAEDNLNSVSEWVAGAFPDTYREADLHAAYLAAERLAEHAAALLVEIKALQLTEALAIHARITAGQADSSAYTPSSVIKLNPYIFD